MRKILEGAIRSLVATVSRFHAREKPSVIDTFPAPWLSPETLGTETDAAIKNVPIEETERLLRKIGQVLKKSRRGSSSPMLLFARVDTNMVSASVFRDLGRRVLYVDPDERFYDLLGDLWQAQKGEDRWSEMEYVLRDQTFAVTYTYPDQLEADRDWMQYRSEIVKRHFGAKPVVYLPWPRQAS